MNEIWTEENEREYKQALLEFVSKWERALSHVTALKKETKLPYCFIIWRGEHDQIDIASNITDSKILAKLLQNAIEAALYEPIDETFID